MPSKPSKTQGPTEPEGNSKCLEVPDEECVSRRDCKNPDGSRCPAYPKRTYGRLI